MLLSSSASITQATILVERWQRAECRSSKLLASVTSPFTWPMSCVWITLLRERWRAALMLSTCNELARSGKTQLKVGPVASNKPLFSRVVYKMEVIPKATCGRIHSCPREIITAAQSREVSSEFWTVYTNRRQREILWNYWGYLRLQLV